MSNHHPMWKPHTPYALTIVLGVLAFVSMSVVSYRAVQVANRGQADARTEAQLARIAASDSQQKLNEVQRQLECVVAILAKATSGNLQNSIAQDDMLLSGFNGVDSTAFAQILREARAKLQALAEEVATTEQRCR